jgi:hypothetical protein
MRMAMESLMRSKQTATEAAGRGAVTGSGTGARRRLPRSLYAAFLLFAAFSVSGTVCHQQDNYHYTGVDDASKALESYKSTRSEVESELASPTPDLMKIGAGLQEMEKYRQSIFDIAYVAEGDGQVEGAQFLTFRLLHADDYKAVELLKSEAEGTLKDQIALTDQFDRLGGWGVANAQHKVLTSGGKWNWVTLGTNPDLNPGGPTFTGKTSPRGGSGCAPGQTFIIGVGCV